MEAACHGKAYLCRLRGSLFSGLGGGGKLIRVMIDWVAGAEVQGHADAAEG